MLPSHGNGWYNVGEARDYNFLHDEFLPAYRQTDAAEALIRKLTVDNPARAFALG
ncbi:MAG TPA: hypothetical protein VMF06_16535 [Candidatus Limnocylindria bacterium]|nr:hypothetical protein [Candidatus Limnocylindria bacterium]